MARLRVSVRSVLEACLALHGGAEVIDLKEPRRGALGRVDESVARAVARELPAATPTGLCLGEWREERGRPARPIGGAATFLKVGLAGLAAEPAEEWQPRFRDWRERVAGEAERRRGRCWVAVLYADWARAAAPGPEEVLALAEADDFAALLVDTFDKGLGADGLFRCLGETRLAELVAAARSRGLLVALAGSLSLAGARRAAALGADLVGARGAVCASGQREGALSPALVARFAAALAAPSAPEPTLALGS
jgi:uncharacterized protein (UPF0264 family)